MVGVIETERESERCPAVNEIGKLTTCQFSVSSNEKHSVSAFAQHQFPFSHCDHNRLQGTIEHSLVGLQKYSFMLGMLWTMKVRNHTISNMRTVSFILCRQTLIHLILM